MRRGAGGWVLNGRLGYGGISLQNALQSVVQVLGLEGDVTAISAGGTAHTCAIQRGAAWCWGEWWVMVELGERGSTYGPPELLRQYAVDLA